jgi:hypothetical protein
VAVAAGVVPDAETLLEALAAALKVNREQSQAAAELREENALLWQQYGCPPQRGGGL